MRSSTVIALAIVASAAPAFSVPLPQSDYTYDLTARDTLSERDLAELFARAQAEVPEGDESGAINLVKLGSKGVKALIGEGKNSNHHQQKPREYYDFEARDDLEARDDYLELRDDLEARDDLDFELFAREEPQDQSGAFKLPGFIGKIASTLFGREDLEELLAREDIQEILAREDLHDQSGAFKLPGFIGKIASTLFGREDLEELLAREDIQELLARQEPQDQSGAFKLPGIIGTIASTLFGREDLEEMFAREEYFARSMNELD